MICRKIANFAAGPLSIRQERECKMSKTTAKELQFEKIYTEHYIRLYYLALHIVNDEDVSKDILNDIFTSLWNNFSGIKHSNVYAYLSTSVRNRAVDHLRHTIQQAKYTEEYLHEAERFYSEYSDESDREVEAMLAQLKPPTDEILKMCYLQRMKYSEVAKALHISPSTVKKHISKALKTLRELYKDKKDTRFV